MKGTMHCVGFEIYTCPESPTEYGVLVAKVGNSGSNENRDAVYAIVDKHNEVAPQGGKWFAKVVWSDGQRWPMLML